MLSSKAQKPCCVCCLSQGSVMQALEEQCQRQSLMTARLVEERNKVLGIHSPFDTTLASSHNERSDASMYALCPPSNSMPVSRPRTSAPKVSRAPKGIAKDTQANSPGHQGAARRTSQELTVNRQWADGGDGGQSHGETAAGVQALQAPQAPLKAWGSTGKRQPGRSRPKA